MKKSLLSTGLLAGLFSISAQSTLHVDDQSSMYVSEESLLYNGGGMQTKGAGLLDVYGNVMVVGGNTDTFRTLTVAGLDKSNAEDNIVLRLNDAANYGASKYGQLYITGILQGNMNAFVTKEYKAKKHGAYQQMALPFYEKTLVSLAQDLGVTEFSNLRRNPSVMYWDNKGMPQFHHILRTQGTQDKHTHDTDNIPVKDHAARYYIVGTGSDTNTWDPEGSVKKISGRLYSDVDEIKFTLKNAGYNPDGTPVPYGVGTGRRLNNHRELVYSYLQDVLDYNTQGFFNQTIGSENGTFGRNYYQFGNPFMTNIDLSTIGYKERTDGTDDGNTLCQIQAIRYEATGAKITNQVNGSTFFKYITYTDKTPSGIPIGDYEGALIKPMQSFAIKMRNNTCPDNERVFSFNKLRRFSYKPRRVDPNSNIAFNPYGVNSDRNGNISSIKQLKVIAFDSDDSEVGRTYFVVSDQFKTGVNNGTTVQVGTSIHSNVFTKEELPTGGADTSLISNTAMYINEANETDFEGKKMHLETKLANVAKYKFELAENAQGFTNGQSQFADGGKSFYIEQTPGQFVKITHDMVVSATVGEAGLYFGLPATAQLSINENKLEVDNELEVAYEKESSTHQVIFPKRWNKATVTIFDMSGRRISVNRDVDASKNFVLPSLVEGAYIVEVVSDKGVKAVRKVIK
ncbi:T9SS type A sorting domain-containing protein [Bergeyella zoohelcum]|uniref:T9SS type A sorting domain-containing protein n=1 Tax=Bergeyella zoohelcum TaxID=1015 RepID=UPI002A91B7C5|nr:T9SS type A sorting domain-containing protein [Bergeyella zoohelcum]MDY6026136.1 T9SS type A sorting domain-containing protein [Bergeyella zoohelcum]